jgi:hypothetical protein
MAMKLRHPVVDVKTYLEALALVEGSSSELPNVKIFEARIVSDEYDRLQPALVIDARWAGAQVVARGLPRPKSLRPPQQQCRLI